MGEITKIDAKSGAIIWRLGGRKIDLRFGKIAASDAQNEAAWAAACASLTEDEKVDFVVSYATFNETRIACYAKHGVPVLDDQSFLPDGVGQRYPGLDLTPWTPGQPGVTSRVS